jgi:hypothetical protein
MAMDSLEEAIEAFNMSLSEDGIDLNANASLFEINPADPYAGRAALFSELDVEDALEIAIGMADTALAIDNRYVFLHRTGWDSLDLRLLRIEANFFLSGENATRLLDVQEEVDALRRILGGAATNLNPSDPAFRDNLLAAIDSLGTSISAR